MKRRILIIIFIPLLFIFCSRLDLMDVIIAEVIGQTVIYVDASAPSGGDGTSWSTAYKYLVDACLEVDQIQHAYNWAPVIYVAEGVYYPGESENQWAIDNTAPENFGNFGIISHLQMLGGFPSGGGKRDPEKYISVISGDIDKNDITNIDGVTENIADIVGTNRSIIIFVHGANADEDLFDTQDTLVDGFTITGSAGGDPEKSVIGCFSESFFQPTLSNLIFTGNQSAAIGIGGGPNGDCAPIIQDCTFKNSSRAVIIGGHTAPVFKRVIFQENTASDGGGAVYADTYLGSMNNGIIDYFNDIELVFLECVFEGNDSASSGGAVNILCGEYGSINASFINCRFLANQAGSGGAMFFKGTPAKSLTVNLTNCEFTGNTASGNAGAIYFQYNLNAAIGNCSFSANEAVDQGASIYIWESDPVFTNSVFWGNTSSGNEINGYQPDPTFRYCDLAGSGGSASWNSAFGTDGGGNIDTDPFFSSIPDSGGYWPTLADNDYGNLMPQAGSPVINAGNNFLISADSEDMDGDGNSAESIPYDLAGNQRISGTAVDMGAYEL